MAYEPTPFDQYTTFGLTEAQKLYQQQQAQGFQYPSYVSGATNAPTKENYFNYTPTAPMAQVQTPNYQLSAGGYQGLMGGDYDKLQSALQQPGQMAATDAYNTGYTNLNNTMGGRGLYGSSMMANQATQGLDKTYQNALASNASGAVATARSCFERLCEVKNRCPDRKSHGQQARCSNPSETISRQAPRARTVDEERAS